MDCGSAILRLHTPARNAPCGCRQVASWMTEMDLPSLHLPQDSAVFVKMGLRD